MPNRLGANEDELTFATGQRLTNAHGFLAFWQAHDGQRLLGMPVTRPLSESGMTVQYFERGRLELHQELDGSPIMLGRVGAEYAGALFQSFPAVSPEEALPGDQLFTETGHLLRDPFLSFWQQNDGMTMFGYPLSEPLWEYVGTQMLQVQYFERARLEYHPLAEGTPDVVQISPLGRDLAMLKNLDMAPEVEAVAIVPEAAPAAPEAAVGRPMEAGQLRDAPAPKPAASKPAAQPKAAAKRSAPANNIRGKSIIVDIGDQWLYALEDGVVVFDAPVSTGKNGFNTPTGTFAVYAKLRSQTMEGTLGGEYYKVPNVPHVMYINGGVALHGTYWHNQFGTGVRRSHGCVNLPVKAAAWLYGWAPMGTPVTVRA